MNEYQLFIDGKYQSSASGTFSDDMNPATNEVYAKVQNAQKEDLETVISSSQKAFETWKDLSSVRPGETISRRSRPDGRTRR